MGSSLISHGQKSRKKEQNRVEAYKRGDEEKASTMTTKPEENTLL